MAKVEHDHGRDGEFTFTPPVPDYRHQLPDGTGASSFGYFADDGLTAPEEYRAIVDRTRRVSVRRST